MAGIGQSYSSGLGSIHFLGAVAVAGAEIDAQDSSGGNRRHVCNYVFRREL